MRYYLIAGEASGDLHGANLMRELALEDADAVFRFFGGDEMEKVGGKAVKHISDMSFMGFVEVVANLPAIFRNIRLAKKDIAAFQPDAVVLIDFPGFNLRIAEFAKQQGVRVIYYISPKIWAWNQKRVFKIRKVVDKMLCILPFEKAFYKKFGMEVDYVGNPVLDAIHRHIPDEAFKAQLLAGGKPVIALLPGSRKQEISKLLPVMVATAGRFPGHTFVVAGAPGFTESDYGQFTGGQFSVVFDHTYDLLAVSEAAVVASGTAVLETALLKIPQVAVYKANALTVIIIRMLIQIPFITLPNLIVNRKIVTELIQDECNPDQIQENLIKLLPFQADRSKQLRDYEELAEIMGDYGASKRAARAIYSHLMK